MGWTGAINGQVCAIKSHWNFSQRTHPIHPIGPWTQVLVCFILFGCILDLFRYCTKLSVERIELVQLMKKFVPWNCIRVFRNERTRSSPLDAKLMNWCVLQCLRAFWIVSLLHETRFEIGWTGAINAKVRATNSHRNFWQRTHAIHPIGP